MAVIDVEGRRSDVYVVDPLVFILPDDYFEDLPGYPTISELEEAVRKDFWPYLKPDHEIIFRKRVIE